jgi:hypothetical protein
MAQVPKAETLNPEIDFQNTGQVIDVEEDSEAPQFYEPTENDKKLVQFIVDHTDKWRDYRNQNYLDDYLRYERIFRGQWKEEDKTRQSERSRVISPATQQAIETRHAEIMEAIFGQGEFFDIKDDLQDKQNADVEMIKRQLYEDFGKDKIRKSFDSVVLMAEIYGMGIGEIIIGSEKVYQPMQMPMPNQPQVPGQQMVQMAYGVGEKERMFVKLNPINPKNFLWDPNGTDIDDCMGVAVERYTSSHKVAKRISSGEYKNVDIGDLYKDDSLEPTQEETNFETDKVLTLTYYGLVPKEYLQNEEFEDLFEEEKELADAFEDYEDMVEAIVVIGNGSVLLKAVESPYMMKDRPILSYQADTVPNRLPGRGTAEKAFNMQMAVDGSMRSHLDALALTVHPMMAMDATRLPRGAKFEVKPGKAFMTNGNPNEILFPFKFGQSDGAAMQTSKEFERMLLMATATMDSNGMIEKVARDTSGLDMATATLIKKYKRTLVNFQEDFLIPFVYKAAYRYMQFDPDRYPSVDVKFCPTGTLGIIAREYETKQLAFLMQTLGAQSPLTPILMQGILKNSSIANREEMLAEMAKMSQPNPEQQQMQQMAVQLDGALKQAEVQLKNAQSMKAQADAQKAQVEAQLAPDEMKARIIAAVSNNLDEDQEGVDFERRMKLADLLLKEKDIDSNERIAKMQVDSKKQSDYVNAVKNSIQ